MAVFSHVHTGGAFLFISTAFFGHCLKTQGSCSVPCVMKNVLTILCPHLGVLSYKKINKCFWGVLCHFNGC